MRRRDFIRHFGIVAALPWLGRPVLAATGSAPPGKSGMHKVLTCNVRVDVPADGKAGNGWADRKELCAEVMRAQKPDLVCLQECQHVHFQHLKTRLPELDSFALSNPDAPAHPHNAILFSRARYELVSAGGFWLSQTPHVAGTKSWDSAEARFVNWVHLRECGAGKEFRLWNTHLDHRGQVARENQAKLIVQASAVLPGTLPQLLTGDFNANAANPAIKLLAAGGWTDTYSAVHGPADPGYTAHAFLGPQYAATKLNGRPGTRIDWIWCRGPVKPLSAQVIRDGRNGRFPSDHYFVSAVVTI
ncbi:MAG TPA: endonuclease/exonuclease/phosphatase family protein [Candidatus Paceibacterota bacterium]|nr:endonuclease/exonuclease/phosphatase family protein [Verrucomicrobiota bacterium]HSA09785.1 endonuclease/exonuclease/phosphatase family protein [Candidatus Paceibacterota bacterium]